MVWWVPLVASIVSSVAAAAAQNKGQNQTLSAESSGQKPMMNVVNPYKTTAITGSDPYGQSMNPMMRKQPTFSSTLGRYGGLG